MRLLHSTQITAYFAYIQTRSFIFEYQVSLAITLTEIDTDPY